MVTHHPQLDPSNSLTSELRRGALVLVVLNECRALQYGYSLKQSLADAGVEISEGTLYPLLRRLEGQGLLESEWQVVDDQRPRRYYKLSPAGANTLSELTSAWRDLVGTLDNLGIGKEQER
ncbi:MAG: PadR family transcriptional regulator [Actinobacteria bacterium]|nr:PadR family transcriptional regulator [Actinomycetota bacterium]